MKTDHLINALVQDLKTPTARVLPVLVQWLPMAASIMAVGFLAVAGIRADVFSTGLPPTLLKVALGAALALIALLSAVRLARPAHDAGRPARFLFVAPIAAALIVAADLALFGGANWQERLWGKNIWACLAAIPLLSIVPLIAVMVSLHHGATEHPMTTGALAGIGSAGLAIIAYGLFCTEDTALFIAIWYVLAACIAGLVGAITGRVALRW